MNNPYKIIYELRETIAELSERCREQEADIEELLKEREWISVKDRLPEPFKPVLVYDAFEKDVTPGIYGNGDWLFSKHITHWMPLPDLPESEDDAE